MTDENPRSLSKLIEDTVLELGVPTTEETKAGTIERDVADKLKFSEIVAAFHERGFGMLLLILAAPMALPIPVPPGVNIILASPLIFLTAQQAIGKHKPWLPQFILKKQIKRSLFQKTMLTILPWLKRIEKISHARLGFLTHGLFSHTVGISGLIMALCVCIPIPGTNSVPSLGIAVMAIGILMRDGLAVIAGMAIGLAWILLLLVIGVEGLQYVKDLIL